MTDEATRTELANQVTAASAFSTALSDVEPPVVATREGGDVVLAPDPDFDPGVVALTDAVTAATEAVQASHTQWAYDRLSTAVQDADAALEASNGQVTDTSTRDTLSAALTTGQTLVDAGAEEAEASELTAAAESITTAQDDVESSRAQWLHDALTNRVSETQNVLNTSNGQVNDNAVRDALFLELAEARRILDAGPGATSPADVLAARDRLNTASAAVSEAVTQWQAGQPQG
ncbi:hypothetical protein [Litorihabitans aurantiacus]|uniref:Uncharacterized protein n=1 Tax=Litorihabitans aurantiacus TaxID=1930061 RepID=A0AA37XHE9_9MICO|nr:hypothetical protein [Litorihabitans aurantiacus]GMA33793.1 hypothetical protein GCM10025875_37850 [Litorihabitans aurantiacus]